MSERNTPEDPQRLTLDHLIDWLRVKRCDEVADEIDNLRTHNEIRREALSRLLAEARKTAEDVSGAGSLRMALRKYDAGGS